MAVQIHTNLKPLADVCGAGDRRYPSNGVRILATADGYRAEATNGRILARVDGKPLCGDPDAAIPPAPNGAADTIVDRKDWLKAQRLVSKAAPRLYATQADQLTTFAGGCAVLSAMNVEGRWPNTDLVIPAGPVIQTIKIRASDLAAIAALAGAIGECVTIEVRDGKAPLVFLAAGDEQAMTAVACRQ